GRNTKQGCSDRAICGNRWHRNPTARGSIGPRAAGSTGYGAGGLQQFHCGLDDAPGVDQRGSTPQRHGQPCNAVPFAAHCRTYRISRGDYDATVSATQFVNCLNLSSIEPHSVWLLETALLSMG